MKLPKSRTSPTRSAATSARSRRSTSGQSEAGMNAREAAEHFWPWYSKAPRGSAGAPRGGAARGGGGAHSLPAGLADEPRVAPVAPDAAPDRLPDRAERRRRAREVHARQVGRGERRPAPPGADGGGPGRA